MISPVIFAGALTIFAVPVGPTLVTEPISPSQLDLDYILIVSTTQ